MKTGGGSYVLSDLNEIDKAIYDIIGPQIDGLSNTYDDDSIEKSQGKKKVRIV